MIWYSNPLNVQYHTIYELPSLVFSALFEYSYALLIHAFLGSVISASHYWTVLDTFDNPFWLSLINDRSPIFFWFHYLRLCLSVFVFIKEHSRPLFDVFMLLADALGLFFLACQNISSPPACVGLPQARVTLQGTFVYLFHSTAGSFECNFAVHR